MMKWASAMVNKLGNVAHVTATRKKARTGNTHTNAGELAGERPAPRPRRTRARTHASRAHTTPHARTNTHTGPTAEAASKQQSISMCILQPQHSISARQFCCMHSACSRQWPGGRPGQYTGQAAGSAPAHARGRAAAPASGEARGERGEERRWCARREKSDARAEKVHACPIRRKFHSARNYLRNRLPVPKSPQSRAALRAQHVPVAIKAKLKQPEYGK